MSDIKNPDYEFDDLDRKLMQRVRVAMANHLPCQDPLKDFLDDCDISPALELLVMIVDGKIMTWDELDALEEEPKG